MKTDTKTNDPDNPRSAARTAAATAGAAAAVGATSYVISQMGDTPAPDTDIIDIDNVITTPDDNPQPADDTAAAADTAATAQSAAQEAAAAAQAADTAHNFSDWGEEYLADTPAEPDTAQPDPAQNDTADAEPATPAEPDPEQNILAQTETTTHTAQADQTPQDSTMTPNNNNPEQNILADADTEPAPEQNILADADAATPFSGQYAEDLAAVSPQPFDDYDSLMADLGIQGDDDLLTIDQDDTLAQADTDPAPQAIPMDDITSGYQAADPAADLATATINIDLDPQPLDTPEVPLTDITIDTDADNLMAAVEAQVGDIVSNLADEGLVASTQGTFHQEIDETDTLAEGLIQFDEIHTATGPDGHEMTVATAHYSDDGMPVMMADTTGDGRFDSYVDAAGNILGTVNANLTTDDAQVQIYGDDDYIAGTQFDVDTDLEHLTAMTNTDLDADFNPAADIIDTSTDMV